MIIKIMPVENGKTKNGRKVSGISGCVRDKEGEQQRLIKVKKKSQPATPAVIFNLPSHDSPKQRSALTLSGTMMFGRTREGDMSMVFLCFGLCLSRSLCF